MADVDMAGVGEGTSKQQGEREPHGQGQPMTRQESRLPNKQNAQTIQRMRPRTGNVNEEHHQEPDLDSKRFKEHPQHHRPLKLRTEVGKKGGGGCGVGGQRESVQRNAHAHNTHTHTHTHTYAHTRVHTHTRHVWSYKEEGGCVPDSERYLKIK